MTPRGNPHPHRYKYGVPKTIIELPIFQELMRRVTVVDLTGYSVLMIQACHALFFWTGLRASEVFGRGAIRYKVYHKPCKGKGCSNCNGTGRVLKQGPPHPGIRKEDFRMKSVQREVADGVEMKDEFLLVSSVGENVLKHGSREQPIWLPKALPFVDRIIAQVNLTAPKRKVFPIGYVTFWRICKRMDPKLTIHFYRHNRVTDMADDDKTSMQQICDQFGFTPRTVADYMMRAGRFSRRSGERLRERFTESEQKET